MRTTSILLLLLAFLCGCPASPSTDGGVDGGLGGGAGGGSGGGGGADAGMDAGVPLRILVLFDGAPSLAVSDPNATRIEALRALLVAHAGEPTTAVGVMAFAGSTTAWFGPNSTPEFVPMSSLTSSDRNTLLARLASFAAPGDGGVVVDFVRALGDGFFAVSTDISRRQGSNYEVIFLSDGRPSNDQDDQLLCGDAVKRIRDLRLAGAGDVRVHTVHVYTPLAAPTCTGDAGWTGGSACKVATVGNPTECPAAEIDADAARLRQMSVVGGGEFRDVRGQASVDFTGLVP